MVSLRSEVTRKLLNYFFINPQESLYVNELARKLGVDKRNLVRKLAELESLGILESQARGNLKLFSINRKYSLYEELKSILSKTFGVEASLRKIAESVEGINRAYIYGSFAGNKMEAHSDIDLLVIGKHSQLLLQKQIGKLQRGIQREINTVNMDEAEFNRRKRDKDPFITGLFRGKYITLK